MKKLILAALMVVSISAHAEFMSGNDLLQYINGDGSDVSFANGYIAGIADTQANENICLPGSVALKQVRDMVAQTLMLNPTKRHLSADLFVVKSLSDAFPCPKRGKNV
jgi:hypothetical protein